ncbi:hypothetical protein NB636_04745 [Oxalobacter aliiformigenes]|uniref:hypothetical protein n=1 Tax=Oxalobacter aliiformigenes TaxID=2946593 RepID=UPI0022AF4296|nr:hypothetical protein [Oxalobacter aliiformigenes]MCZ4064944.1 hypothetical protein [Oxalobacter aliiformigenes]WAW00156.1 hypothetical protein NB636_04745 [Oxalobacter aliiformigenes]
MTAVSEKSVGRSGRKTGGRKCGFVLSGLSAQVFSRGGHCRPVRFLPAVSRGGKKDRENGIKREEWMACGENGGGFSPFLL